MLMLELRIFVMGAAITEELTLRNLALSPSRPVALVGSSDAN